MTNISDGPTMESASLSSTRNSFQKILFQNTSNTATILPLWDKYSICYSAQYVQFPQNSLECNWKLFPPWAFWQEQSIGSGWYS